MPLYPAVTGRQIAYGESFSTFDFTGTGGQSAGTLADVGVTTAGTFTITNKPITILLAAEFALRNGGSKFTGTVSLFINAVISAADSPNDGLIGSEVARAMIVHDQVTASSAAANTTFRAGPIIALPRTYAVGAAGLVAGQIPTGTGYQLKVQMTLNNVTNVSGRLAVPSASTTSPCLSLLVLEG